MSGTMIQTFVSVELILYLYGQHKGPMWPNHGLDFTPKLSLVKGVTFLESIAWKQVKGVTFLDSIAWKQVKGVTFLDSIAWKQELDILPIVRLVMPIDATSDTGHICYTYYHFWISPN